MPHLIPTSRDEMVTAIQIYRSPRIGTASYYRLTSRVKSFAAAFDLLLKTTRDQGITGYKPANRQAVIDEIETAKTLNARIIFNGDKNYPHDLAQISTAPPFLWYRGDATLVHRPHLAIVGTRNPSIEGIRMTQLLARAASKTHVIVSGLARGIDTAAHQAALAQGTIAIVAGGIDVHYPQENGALQDNIGERGLIVSEMPFGHQPQASNFPQRNRIIAGLSQAVLVTEAAVRSGTALTVNDAIDIGRDIYAVPGHPFHGLANLPNQLLHDGARMIRNPEDLINALASKHATNIETNHELPEGPTPPHPKSGSEALQKIGDQILKNATKGDSRFFIS